MHMYFPDIQISSIYLSPGVTLHVAEFLNLINDGNPHCWRERDSGEWKSKQIGTEVHAHRYVKCEIIKVKNLIPLSFSSPDCFTKATSLTCRSTHLATRF